VACAAVHARLRCYSWRSRCSRAWLAPALGTFSAWRCKKRDPPRAARASGRALRRSPSIANAAIPISFQVYRVRYCLWHRRTKWSPRRALSFRPRSTPSRTRIFMRRVAPCARLKGHLGHRILRDSWCSGTEASAPLVWMDRRFVARPRGAGE
jgi:hypothetical protein